MSIAWATVALLILLLPGFLFFVGLAFPESFTRENIQRSPLGQLAGTVFVSLVVHATLFLLCHHLYIETHQPRYLIRLEYVFAVLQLQGAEKFPLEVLAQNVFDFRWPIIQYLLTASYFGWLIGAGVGEFGVTRGRLRFLARHGWIYQFHHGRKAGLTKAYVMTHVRKGDEVLMYSGFLRDFGLSDSGQFSYLVLRDARRYYMVLGDEANETTSGKQIAERGGSQGDRILFIEGEDVANLYLERIPRSLDDREGAETLNRALAQLGKRPTRPPFRLLGPVLKDFWWWHGFVGVGLTIGLLTLHDSSRPVEAAAAGLVASLYWLLATAKMAEKDITLPELLAAARRDLTWRNLRGAADRSKRHIAASSRGIWSSITGRFRGRE